MACVFTTLHKDLSNSYKDINAVFRQLGDRVCTQMCSHVCNIGQCLTRGAWSRLRVDCAHIGALVQSQTLAEV